MASLNVSRGTPSSSLIALGFTYNQRYFLHDDCMASLNDMVTQLRCEDPIHRPVRKEFGFTRILEKDLLPILIRSNINTFLEKEMIVRTVIELMLDLMTPLECLSVVGHVQSNVDDYTNYLIESKEAFLEPMATKFVIEWIYQLLKREADEVDHFAIHQSLSLLRNILYAPERPPAAERRRDFACGSNWSPWSAISRSEPDNHSSPQGRLLWNLFGQGFGRLIVNVLSYPERTYWVATIMEIVAIVFKDQPIERVMNTIGEEVVGLVSTSDSDEDDDDDKQSSSCEAKKTVKRMSKRNHRSRRRFPNSTILNYIKSRGVASYAPTVDDIGQLIAKFTAEFITQGGFYLLCNELHRLTHNYAEISQLLDQANVIWFITVFLKIFRSHLRSKWNVTHYLPTVLNPSVLNYLTWVAVREAEELEIGLLDSSSNLQPITRRLHLCVIAIREFLNALNAMSSNQHKNKSLLSTTATEDWVQELCQIIPTMKDLHQLFVLLLRRYRNDHQSNIYLNDVIVTNQVLLLTLEKTIDSNSPETLRSHLMLFCNTPMMERYGRALKGFATNGTYVNDCIMTMLYRVGGPDLNRMDLLCQTAIVQPFTQIWRAHFQMREEWHNLIEYVVRRFQRCVSAKKRDGALSSFLEETAVGSTNITSVGGDGLCFADAGPITACIDTLEHCKNQLIALGFRKHLCWIQSALLASCAARLGISAGKTRRHTIAVFSHHLGVSCPVVPWTMLEEAGLHSEDFLHLLYRLGLMPPSVPIVSSKDVDRGVYPRIPNDWNPNQLFSIARFLGPVHRLSIDFDLSLVHSVALPIAIYFTDVDDEIYRQDPRTAHTLELPRHWRYWVDQANRDGTSISDDFN